MTTRAAAVHCDGGYYYDQDRGPSYHCPDLAVTLGVYRDWREASTDPPNGTGKGVMTQAAEIATMNNDANRLEQLQKRSSQPALRRSSRWAMLCFEIRDKRLYKSTHKDVRGLLQPALGRPASTSTGSFTPPSSPEICYPLVTKSKERTPFARF